MPSPKSRASHFEPMGKSIEFETLDLGESDNGQASFSGYPALHRVTTYCLDTQHTGRQAR
jgi:hypothetical protein